MSMQLWVVETIARLWPCNQNLLRIEWPRAAVGRRGCYSMNQLGKNLGSRQLASDSNWVNGTTDQLNPTAILSTGKSFENGSPTVVPSAIAKASF